MGLSRLSSPWRDGVLGWFLFTVAVVQLAASGESVSLATGVWVVLSTLPLVVRGRNPILVGLGMQVVFAAGTPFVRGPELLGQGIAVFLVATYVAALGAPGWRGSVACGVGSVAVLALQGVLDPRYGAAGAVVANCVYVAMSWAVAAAVRLQVDRSRSSVAWAVSALEQSEANAARAAQAERDRLARELHDVLGHSISVIVLRARGGVHDFRSDPARAVAALRDVEEVGTQALADVRLLLDMDTSAAAPDESEDRRPLPGVEEIGDLIERTRTSGLDVVWDTAGQPTQVPVTTGLTAYRIVQESLTNVMRHSAAAVASVRLTWSPGAVEVEVVDPGPARPSPSGGHGLAGMKERASLLGGVLDAGPDPRGGFRVFARLPFPVLP